MKKAISTLFLLMCVAGLAVRSVTAAPFDASFKLVEISGDPNPALEGPGLARADGTLEPHQSCYRLAGLADDDLLTGEHALDKRRQLSLGFRDVGNRHHRLHT